MHSFGRQFLAGLLLLCGLLPAQDQVVIGSKPFTESVVLAELMAQLIEADTELTVQRKVNLGGTKICWDALCGGSIDIYAEYTGTAWAVILKQQGKVADPLRTYLRVQRRSRVEHDVFWL